MRCYRSVQVEFGTHESLFSGAGSFTTAGRWNHTGERVIYTSTSVTATASERAFNSLLGQIRMYNDKIKENGKNIPQSYFDSISRIKFKIGKILIKKENELLNLKDQNVLSEKLQEAGISLQTVHSARLSKYKTLKQFWTRDISQFLNANKFKGFFAPSARTNSGDTLVIFEDNIDSDFYQIEEITDLTISAINTNNGPLKHGQIASESHIAYSCTFDSGIAEILKI